MNPDERKKEENWKWGIFYVNPKDPQIIVPKRNPWLGWTLNFGRWEGYLAMLLLLGLFWLVASN